MLLPQLHPDPFGAGIEDVVQRRTLVGVLGVDLEGPFNGPLPLRFDNRRVQDEDRRRADGERPACASSDVLAIVSIFQIILVAATASEHVQREAISESCLSKEPATNP
jgi:hypothetical protein